MNERLRAEGIWVAFSTMNRSKGVSGKLIGYACFIIDGQFIRCIVAIEKSDLGVARVNSVENMTHENVKDITCLQLLT